MLKAGPDQIEDKHKSYLHLLLGRRSLSFTKSKRTFEMPVARYEFTEVDENPLAQPLTFKFSKRTAKNRLMKAAMEERLAT
jgi:hypothetical protein